MRDEGWAPGTPLRDVVPAGTPNRPTTILLADDAPMILAMMQACLESTGHQVLVARDGLEAVELLTAHRTEVGLAVLDVDMPRMGGLEALEYIRQIRPDIPAMISTGHSAGMLAKTWSPPEGVEIIEKPYDLADLIERVREVLDGS